MRKGVRERERVRGRGDGVGERIQGDPDVGSARRGREGGRV